MTGGPAIVQIPETTCNYVDTVDQDKGLEITGVNVVSEYEMISVRRTLIGPGHSGGPLQFHGPGNGSRI